MTSNFPHLSLNNMKTKTDRGLGLLNSELNFRAKIIKRAALYYLCFRAPKFT
jgi:hypothetical protein